MTLKQRFYGLLKNRRFRFVIAFQIIVSILFGIGFSIMASSDITGDLITKILSGVLVFCIFTIGMFLFTFVVCIPAYLIVFFRLEKIEAFDNPQTKEGDTDAMPIKKGWLYSFPSYGNVTLESQKKTYEGGSATFFALFSATLISNLIFTVMRVTELSNNFIVGLLINISILGLIIGGFIFFHISSYEKLFKSHLPLKAFLKGLGIFDAIQIIFSFFITYSTYQNLLKCDCLDLLPIVIISQVVVIVFINIEVLTIWFVKKHFSIDNKS